MKDYVRDLYKKISENVGETPELFHYDYFKLEGGELYYIGSRKPLTIKGVLMSSMAWVKRCYSEKSKNLNKLLVFEALYP